MSAIQLTDIVYCLNFNEDIIGTGSREMLFLISDAVLTFRVAVPPLQWLRCVMILSV